MTREQAINYLISSGFSEEQVSEVVRALTYQPTTKNDLGVDAISRQDVLNEMDKRHLEGDYITKGFIKKLPSVTPQKPIIDKIDEIITDALDKSTDQKESQTLRWVLDKISEVT